MRFFIGSGAARTYTDQRIADLVDSAPEALNTLQELAAALDDDAEFATTVVNALATKANFAVVADEAALLDLDVSVGFFAFREDVSGLFVLLAEPADSVSNWGQVSTGGDSGFSPFLLSGM